MQKDPRKQDSQTRVNLYLDKDLNGDDQNRFLQDLEGDEELGRTLKRSKKLENL